MSMERTFKDMRVDEGTGEVERRGTKTGPGNAKCKLLAWEMRTNYQGGREGAAREGGGEPREGGVLEAKGGKCFEEEGVIRCVRYC